MQTFAAEQLEHLSGQACNRHTFREEPVVFKIFGALQLHTAGGAEAKLKFSLQVVHTEWLPPLGHSLQPPRHRKQPPPPDRLSKPGSHPPKLHRFVDASHEMHLSSKH